jgi:hypothetical protein
MNTAERIAWGLLSFIVLIGWLRYAAKETIFDRKLVCADRKSD